MCAIFRGTQVSVSRVFAPTLWQNIPERRKLWGLTRTAFVCSLEINSNEIAGVLGVTHQKVLKCDLTAPVDLFRLLHRESGWKIQKCSGGWEPPARRIRCLCGLGDHPCVPVEKRCSLLVELEKGALLSFCTCCLGPSHPSSNFVASTLHCCTGVKVQKFSDQFHRKIMAPSYMRATLGTRRNHVAPVEPLMHLHMRPRD